MKKLLTRLLLTILIIGITMSQFSSSVEAATTDTYYGIEISSINDETTRRYVSSLYLKPEADAYRLIVNNESIGSVSGNGGTLKYYPNSSVTITFNINIPNKTITFSSTHIEVEAVDCELDFSATNFDGPDYQTLVIRPNKKSGTSVTLTARLNDNGWFYFDEYTYNYNGIGKTFNISLNSNNGTVYNGSTPVGSLGSNNKVNIKLWYEDHIAEDRELDMDYIELFTPKSFNVAKNSKPRLYSTTEVESALASYVRNHSQTLHNNATKDTVDFVLRETIQTRPRLNEGAAIGDGVYGDPDGGTFQAICQWHEDACSTIRSKIGDAARPYAVIDYTRSYRSLERVTGTKYTSRGTKYGEELTYYPSVTGDYIKVQESRAKITYPDDYTWSDTAWPSYACSSGLCQHTTRTMYSQRTRTWGAWSDYIYSSGGTNTEAGEWESKTFYAKSTRGWTGWSTWSKDNSCGLFESDCEDESRVRYDTKYATYSDWSSWTSWDTAFFGCSSSTLKECESKEWYRYRTRSHTPASYSAWSGWSAYEYALLGCSGSDTKECRTTTARAFRKIGDWSGWSDYSTTSCSPTYSGANSTQTTGCMSKTQKCEKTRSTNGYTYSNYKYTYGSKPSPAYNCSSSTVTSSSCGTKTQYAASCSCTSPSTNKKTCTGSYYDSKTPCTISGCTNRKCSYTSKTVNLSCTRYYCATSRAQAYTSWSSCSYVDGTCGSETSLYTCTSRTVYAERTRSWGSYGNYTLDTTYLNNSLYDYKTQTWYSSRTRTYTPASTGSWSSWTGYVYSSCSETSASDGTLTKDCDSHTEYRSREREYIWHEYTGNYTLTSCSTLDTSSTIPIRYCDSQTQYHKRYMTDWSSYGSYNIEFGSTEYTDCSASNMCRLQSTVKWRTRTRNSWTDWSNYIYTNCVEATTGTILRECQSKIQHGYKMGTVGSYGEWTISSGPQSSSEYKYKYRTYEYPATVSQVMTYYTTSKKTLGSMPRMTESDISTLANQLNEAYATEMSMDAAKEYYNEKYTLNASTFDSWKISNSATYSRYKDSQSADGNNFLVDPNFVPYIFIRAHTRATYKDTAVTAYNSSENYTWEAKYQKTGSPNPDGPHELIEYEDPNMERESKVIYFDYHDPLINYKGNIPSELEGLDAVIRTLENSDIEDEEITMSISKKDIEDMRNWLSSHKYSTGRDCEMLKAFSYIFDAKTQSLISKESCNID